MSKSLLPSIELLLAAQRESWEHGDNLPVEVFLRHYPALRQDTEGLLDLLYNEVFLRERQGETLRPEEYLHRFPELAEAIRAQFDVHQAIQGLDEALPPGLIPNARLLGEVSLCSVETGAVIPVTKSTTMIGRSRECDVVLMGREVSRRHCLLIRTATQVSVEDLGSRGGTRLNGATVSRAPLRDGDRLEVAGKAFQVRLR